MISAITWKLLLVLFAAAFLGLLMGLSGMLLHQARKERSGRRSNQSTVERLTLERDTLAQEKADLALVLEDEQRKTKQSIDKCSQLTTQQDTFKVHTGLQTQRLDKVTAELHLAEEKCIRLQRDFASFKANKLREVRMLKVRSDEWLDSEELPVLNKKVGRKTEQAATAGLSAEAAKLELGANHLDPNHLTMEGIDTEDDFTPSMDETQPIIASELDIPSLAESELPDSVDELEFELADQDEPR